MNGGADGIRIRKTSDCKSDAFPNKLQPLKLSQQGEIRTHTFLGHNQKALPIELLAYLVPKVGFEPTCLKALVSKTSVYAFHHFGKKLVGAEGLEPTNSREGRFTVSYNCHYAMPPNWSMRQDLNLRTRPPKGREVSQTPQRIDFI